MILLLDNYDSFVWNLARYVRELGREPLVVRNDAITVDEVAALAPSHIIISPGPCTPAEAGISVDVIRRFGPTTPIFGVCLGHQAIGAAYGGRVVRAARPMHGKTSDISHDGTGLFAGLPAPFKATRYHSLVIEHVLAARRASRHGNGGGRGDHGGAAPGAPGGRHAVPPRVGAHRGWACDSGTVPGRRVVAKIGGRAAVQSPKLMPRSRAVWMVSESRGTVLVRPITSASGTVEMIGGV